MRISYVNGVCVNHDAISNSIRDEITWLQSLLNNEVRLFTYACDFKEIPFKIVNDIKDVVFDEFFQHSDLVVFHFGVFYQLFNILPVVSSKSKIIVVFHNITPKEFLPISAHDSINKSFEQLANITFATHVVCVSQVNQEVLNTFGINVPSTVLPLALRSGQPLPKRKPSFDDRISRILFVGRLVKSKGPLDLLLAVSNVLAKRLDLILELSFVANLKFSDPDLVNNIRQLSEELQVRFKGRLQIHMYGNAEESLKNKLLAKADLFVLPTSHEGFCVPILEAFENGCCVVAYDNSNVPHISGGFAKLVPTGDVTALARAISVSLDLTRSEEWIINEGYLNYCSSLADYCEQFDPEKVRDRFLNLVKAICTRNIISECN